MGLLIGMFFGVGLLLIIAAVVAPAEATPGAEGRLRGKSRELLASAGIEGLTPGAFIGACVITGLMAFLLMFVVSKTLPVGVVFGLMAGWLPIALVRSRARRRAISRARSRRAAM